MVRSKGLGAGLVLDDTKPSILNDPVGVLAYGEARVPVGTSPTKPELRALLKECVDVLHCHHRNTHKPLIDKLRKARARL